MSYCRFSQTSEVYVYENPRGGITCCFCSLSTESVDLDTPYEMAVHLTEHRWAGDKVPQHVMDQLFDEIWEEIEMKKAPAVNRG